MSSFTRHSVDAAEGVAQEVKETLQNLAEQAKKAESLLSSEVSVIVERSDSDMAALLRDADEVALRVEHIRSLLGPFEYAPRWSALEVGALQSMQGMVQDKRLLTPAELCEKLGWRRQTLSKALTSNRIFFLEVQGKRYYPAFFADPKYQRNQLEAVAKRLGELPGGAKLQFFLTPKASLGGVPPLDALAWGKFSAVKVAADGFAGR